MKITALIFSLFLSVAVSGQTYMRSVLTDNGSAVYTAVVSTASTISPPAPVVFTGHFSKPGQTTDDILTFQLNQDGSASASCLQNNNDGTFSQPNTTSIFPASALPFTVVKVIPSSNPATQSDAVWVGNNNAPVSGAVSGTVSVLSFSLCVPTLQSQSATAGWPANFSDPYNTNITTIKCGGQTIPAQTVLGIINDVWIFDPNGNVVCPGLAPLYASFVTPGPFNTLSTTNSYLFSLVTEEPPSSGAPANFKLVDSAFGFTNGTNLEGQLFLGWVFSPGGIVAVSASGPQVFFDLVTMNSGEPAIINIGTVTLSAPPVAMLAGDFWGNDTEQSDICIANGTEIAIFTYVGGVGTAPAWNLVDTLSASAPIQALTVGDLSSVGDEIIAQEGSNAEIFSLSGAFTQVAAQYTLSVSTSGPGTVQQNPNGTSFSSGTSVTLQAVPDAGASLTSWSGACTGASLTCVVTMTQNESVQAIFATTPPPPSPTPSLAVAPPAATVQAGNSASYAVTPQNFSTAPTLSASCSIPKGSCSIVGGQLVATTTAPTTSAIPVAFDWYRLPWAPMLLAVLVLMSFYLVPPAPKRRTLAVGLAAASCFLLMACGGGSHTATPASPQTIPGTPSGTYSITVVATPSTGAAITSTATLKVM
jgi:hypothetical protein